MPTLTETAPARTSTHDALLKQKRGVFFGLNGDSFVKYVFQGNAMVSIIVLALITFTIFRDAVGFLPANHQNLVVYRKAGLEMVDIFRDQVTAHRTLSRYLANVRADRLAALTAAGLSPADAYKQMAGFDDYANRFAGLFTTVAQAKKVGVVPFFLKGVADGPDPTRLFQADRIHPRAEAHPQMLANVWPELKKLLR